MSEPAEQIIILQSLGRNDNFELEKFEAYFFWNGFSGAERGTHRIWNAIPSGSVVAWSSVYSERIVTMRPQICDSDESFWGGLLN